MPELGDRFGDTIRPCHESRHPRIEPTESDLAQIGRLPRLEDLEISGGQITDAGLLHLGKLTRLQKLTLSAVQVTDAGLLCLSRLTRLQNQQRLAASSLIHPARVGRLTGLKDLDISGG